MYQIELKVSTENITFLMLIHAKFGISFREHESYVIKYLSERMTSSRIFSKLLQVYYL